MVKSDMEQNREAVQTAMQEQILTYELMNMHGKDNFIIETYNKKINQLSSEIAGDRRRTTWSGGTKSWPSWNCCGNGRPL